jgi:hypothetical protein
VQDRVNGLKSQLGYFFNYPVQLRHLYAYLSLYEHIYANSTLRASTNLSRQIIKIDEVTTNASLSMENIAYH